ncbi:protein ORF11 [Lake sturgeon herpesvirus]|nr:protein ORF11 [Lake sturgeon herpesvirus]
MSHRIEVLAAQSDQDSKAILTSQQKKQECLECKTKLTEWIKQHPKTYLDLMEQHIEKKMAKLTLLYKYMGHLDDALKLADKDMYMVKVTVLDLFYRGDHFIYFDQIKNKYSFYAINRPYVLNKIQDPEIDNSVVLEQQLFALLKNN